jgi:hypothetical protein
MTIKIITKNEKCSSNSFIYGSLTMVMLKIKKVAFRFRKATFLRIKLYRKINR